jgi:FMN reductase
VPTGVFAATDDFAGGPELQKRVDRAAGELAMLVTAGAPAAAPAGTVRRTVEDEFAAPTEFEELLRRASAG